MLRPAGDRLKTPRDRSHVSSHDGTLNQKKIRDHHRCPDGSRELGICVFFLAHVFCCKFSGASELPQFRPNRRLHESNRVVDDFNTGCLSELQDLSLQTTSALVDAELKTAFQFQLLRELLVDALIKLLLALVHPLL